MGVPKNLLLSSAAAWIVAVACVFSVRAIAAAKPDLSGKWTLNVDASDHPKQVFGQGDGSDAGSRRGGDSGRGAGRGGRGGFGGRGGGGFGGGGRNRRGGASGNTDDRLRLLELSDEIRHPSATLTIAQHADTLSITDAQNVTRVFRTRGQKDTHQLDAVKVDSETTWQNDRLVIEYDIGSKRKIRYAYSLVPETGQLLVETDLESGNKQSAGTMPVTRVYDSVVVP